MSQPGSDMSWVIVDRMKPDRFWQLRNHLVPILAAATRKLSNGGIDKFSFGRGEQPILACAEEIVHVMRNPAQPGQ